MRPARGRRGWAAMAAASATPALSAVVARLPDIAALRRTDPALGGAAHQNGVGPSQQELNRSCDAPRRLAACDREDALDAAAGPCCRWQ